MTLFTREFLELHFCDKDGKVDCGDDLWINKALDNQEDALRFEEVPLTIRENIEIVEHIREYVDIMKDEPEEWIKLSTVYHHLKRILGDEI